MGHLPTKAGEHQLSRLVRFFDTKFLLKYTFDLWSSDLCRGADRVSKVPGGGGDKRPVFRISKVWGRARGGEAAMLGVEL